MDFVTIKEFAESQHVSYEAIRKQIALYEDDLKGHIVRKKNRKMFLDEFAVEFLRERRRENPVILSVQENHEELEELKKTVESLQAKLMTAQNELMKSKDQIIELQGTVQKGIEEHVKYVALLEDSKARDEKLAEAHEKLGEVRKESETQKKTIEDLTKERDEAQAEVQSFKKSIFGFYRKK